MGPLGLAPSGTENGPMVGLVNSRFSTIQTSYPVVCGALWGSISENPALPDLDFPIKLLNIGSVVANFDFVRPPGCHSHHHRHFIIFCRTGIKTVIALSLTLSSPSLF